MTTVPGWDDYRKSTYSGSGTDCVAVHRALTQVRDTKNMGEAVLEVGNLADSLAAIRSGELDRA